MWQWHHPEAIRYGRLRVRCPSHEGGFPFGSEGRAIVLWYRDAPLALLLDDLEIMLQGLGAQQIMRVYTSNPDALTAVPALCTQRGFTILPFEPLPFREGGWLPAGRYHFDITR